MNIDILWLFLLIISSAFFAIAEISLAGSRQTKLNVLVENKQQNAQLIIEVQAKSGSFIAAVQIALNALAILGGIIGEAAFTPMFKQLLEYVYTGQYLPQLSFTLSFLFVISLFILFADLIPKRIGMAMPEKVAMIIVKPMLLFVRVFSPVIFLFNGMANLLLKVFGLPTERIDIVTTQDIVAVMDAGAAHGSIQSREYNMIGNVFELENRSLTSVMTVRDDIVFFDKEDDSDLISKKIISNPHNSYLVCENSLEKLTGFVESKALLHQVLLGEKTHITDEIVDHDILYLPDSLSLSSALETFKCNSQTIAVVLNEYSLVVGIVTIKNLISVLVDGFTGQFDEQQIIERDTDSWLVDGATSIIDVSRVLKMEAFANAEYYETLSGFIMYELKKLPKLTDTVIFNNHKFEVVDMDNLRISKLLVSKINTDNKL